MTRTTESRYPDTRMPSLWTKLQQFAEGLTPEEEAQLGAMEMHDVSGMMSWPLQDKARQVVDALTREEQAQLRHWVERGDTGTETGEEADTAGFMIAQYDDGQGNKGPPQPVTGTAGGGGFPDRFVHNVKVLFGPLVDELPLVPR